MDKKHHHKKTKETSRKDSAHEIKHQIKKKKFSLFFKAFFCLFVTFFIVLFYFVVLVSNKPRSIPFVTQKIEKVIEENLGSDVEIQDTLVSFTRYGTLKINVLGLKIFSELSIPEEQKQENKTFLIPKIESEFSLLNLLLFHFHPSTVRLIDAVIDIGNLQDAQDTSTSEVFTKQQNELALVLSFLSLVRKGEIPIENFEIENSSLLIRDQDFGSKIFFKKSKIHAERSGTSLNISSENELSFSKINSDETSGLVFLGSNCKLSHNNDLSCDLALKNFIPSTVSQLHESLASLAKISTVLDGNFYVTTTDNQLSDLRFKIRARKGSFDFSNFFENEMFFENFLLDGSYDHKTKILNLGKIETDFVNLPSKNKPVVKSELAAVRETEINSNLENNLNSNHYIALEEIKPNEIAKSYQIARPHLSMSLLISLFLQENNSNKDHINSTSSSLLLPAKNNFSQNAQVIMAPNSDPGLTKHRLDFSIKLQNILNEDLSKFWPKTLDEKGVRSWVLEHISGGVIKKASTNFSMTINQLKNKSEFILEKQVTSNLDDIEAEVIFSGMNLNYDKKFPAIYNLVGVASFSNKDMKIRLTEGDFLQSKITEGLVKIDDFFAPKVMLKIFTKSQGLSADGLKHAHNHPDFATEVEKYLNGNAQSATELQIPLVENLLLRDAYIKINSVINGLKNEYVKGDVVVNCKKDFGSNSFVSDIDLTAAEITANSFDVIKNVGVESALKFNVLVEDESDYTIGKIDKKISIDQGVVKNGEFQSIDKSAEQKILIKNILLTKNDHPLNGDVLLNSKVSKLKNFTARISGDLSFKTAPFFVTAFNLRNENFGKNNYNLTYLQNSKSSPQKISLNGNRLSLDSFLAKKVLSHEAEKFTKPQNPKKNWHQLIFANSQVKITLNQLDLLHKKSLRNLSLNFACVSGLCNSFSLDAFYGDNKKLINLHSFNKTKELYPAIEGRVSDIGFFAEAFGISDLVANGNAKIKIMQRFLDKKPILEGKLRIDDGITIFENEKVKRLSKNNLFSQIRDKIFSRKKTTFDSLKLDFAIHESKIAVNSMVANNLKIGITAKGEIDFVQDNFFLKGMIIPGFIINNLFGIGNIPLIGGVISGLLTGGEGGGVFGISYEYVRKSGQEEGVFTTNKVAAFVPSTIQNLFE